MIIIIHVIIINNTLCASKTAFQYTILLRRLVSDVYIFYKPYVIVSDNMGILRTCVDLAVAEEGEVGGHNPWWSDLQVVCEDPFQALVKLSPFHSKEYMIYHLKYTMNPNKGS